jgi:hypothetical protein
MNRRLSLTPGFLFLLAFAATTPVAAGQDVFVTPVPNVPFTAVINVERSFVRPDGSVANVKTERQIARDSRGRIYNEMRMLVPESSSKAPQVERIHLYDPQTRIATNLNVSQRTYRTMTANRPPATVPPTLLDATPAGNALQQNEFTKKEDLGIQEMGGIPAHGVRETQTISADTGGSGKELVITDEYWYSEDLRINLLIKHNDPRSGAVIMTVGQVQRTEPDPAIFDIPAGYRLAGTR